MYVSSADRCVDYNNKDGREKVDLMFNVVGTLKDWCHLRLIARIKTFLGDRFLDSGPFRRTLRPVGMRKKVRNYLLFPSNERHKMVRTIKKQAPSMTAFMRTSRSIGKLIPKKSASVNISRISPDHCFEILPTSSPFNVTIWNWMGAQRFAAYIWIEFRFLPWIQHLRKWRMCRMDPRCVTQFRRCGSLWQNLGSIST